MLKPTHEQVWENAQTEATKEDMLFATLAGLSGIHGSMSAIGLGRAYMKLCDQSGLKMNPYFVLNGHCATSPKTDKMLANRKWKGASVASTRLGLAATSFAIAPATVPLGVMIHSSATFSTGVHLHKLSSLLDTYKRFEVDDTQVSTAIKWLRLAIKVKQLKLAFRGTEATLSAASTALGISGVGIFGSLTLAVISVQLELARLEFSTKYAVLCKIAAMELQWAAYLEQHSDCGAMPDMNRASMYPNQTLKALAQRSTALQDAQRKHMIRDDFNTQTGKKGLGPATRIIREIMAKHTFQGLFVAPHDHMGMINEPAGWNAIAAKMMNI